MQNDAVDIRDFIGLLKHSRGDFAGHPFVLELWQDSYFDKLLNTKRPDGLRQYRTSLLALPRKNGKTQMAAALGLYMLFADDVGAEVICAAGDRSQASLLHTAAKQLLESCPSLARRAKIYRNSIVVPERNASMFCISSEAGTKHGYNPSCVLIDEYHVFPDRELVDVLETGMGARSQPLTVYITTAGTDKLGPCYKDWQRAEKIRDGLIKDDTFLPCIYAASPDADPFEEATWAAANPNYGKVLKPDYFRAFAERAKASPSDEVVFKTLHLNIWENSTARWLRNGVWEANAGPLRPTAGRKCWCGIDLASNFDTTAFVAVWPDTDGTYDIQCMLFIPEENAAKREREDRVPYQQWAKDGFVRMTEGDVCDYDVVRDYILSFCEKNSVEGIAIDRYNATHLTTQLTNEGVTVKPFGQGFISMSPASKQLEVLAISNQLRHAGNPALAWQVSNVQIKMDDAGNIKPTKKHSHDTGRIDGAVALIMALGIASTANHGEENPYEIMVI